MHAIEHTPPKEQPWSVQMHVHGPFSEGPASIETSTWEAEQIKLDAIWWSEHDWRTSYYRPVTKFSFDSLAVPLEEGESWVPQYDQEAGRQKGVHFDRLPNFALRMEADTYTGTNVFEGSGSLRMLLQHPSKTHSFFGGSLVTARMRQKRNLGSEVVVQLAVNPSLVSADARPVIEFQLSQRMLPNRWGYTQASLRYVWDNSGTPPYRDGNVFVIPRPFTLGQWDTHTFDLLADVALGFPEADPRDNSLNRIRWGIESRRGVTGQALFDDLEIFHAKGPAETAQVQRDLLAQQEIATPTIRQHRGQEISYLFHINEFSLDSQLPDYDALIAATGLADNQGYVQDTDALRAAIAEATIDLVHNRGGLVSLNHMFGTGGSPSTVTKEELALQLISMDAYGVDILEVGYRSRAGRSLADYLWVWDALGMNGIYVLGNGVTDYHGSQDFGNWKNGKNNMVTWIWATSPSKSDLLEGLKRGRIFFGDPGTFDGSLTFRTSDGMPMGSLQITDRTSTELEVDIRGIHPTDNIRFIRNGVLLSERIAGEKNVRLTFDSELLPIEPTVFRIEVIDQDGREKLFSNPLWFARKAPLRGQPGSRLSLHLGGMRSVSLRDFTLMSTKVLGSGQMGFRLEGSSESDGQVVLDFSHCPVIPGQVLFGGGMTGNYELQGTKLVIDSLQGDGWLDLIP